MPSRCASIRDPASPEVCSDPSADGRRMKTRAANAPRRRADVLLVERGLFESRAKAQAAIAAGLVTADAVPVRKASEAIAIDAAIAAEPAFPWVSRGGVKLDAALARFGLPVAAPVCLHVPPPTRPFTHCPPPPPAPHLTPL